MIILPKAGACFEQYNQLVSLLSTQYTVLFVEEGYFGLPLESNSAEYNMYAFSDTLLELVRQKGHKKVTLLAESVGSVHAINIAARLGAQLDICVVVNPAFYKHTMLSSVVLHNLLKLGLHTNPQILLGISQQLLWHIPLSQAKAIAKTFQAHLQSIGATSFLKCLEEIIRFENIYPTLLPEQIQAKSIAIIGKKDVLFKYLCNQQYCQSFGKILYIDEGQHSTLDAHADQIVQTIVKR